MKFEIFLSVSDIFKVSKDYWNTENKNLSDLSY